jgi:hypothetical protein
VPRRPPVPKDDIFYRIEVVVGMKVSSAKWVGSLIVVFGILIDRD